MSEPPPVIELLDVAVASPQQPEVAQVEAINWQVRPGEFWVIGGLHGAGKSNLLATTAGLQNPLRGVVKLFGRDVSDLREKDLEEERCRIGLIFQDGGRNFSRLTVSENIALPMRYHRNLSETEVESELRRLMEPLGLIPLAHHLSRTISLGWQQRVALARALTLKPEVLLLDKPLSSVEIRQRRWWFDFLPRLFTGDALDGQRPVTLVLTTEDIHPWIEIGTHFALLKNNRWQFLGNRAELKGDQERLRELSLDEFIL